jgi:hypothetical protein
MTMWRSNEPVEDDISDLPGIDFQNKCRRARRRAWRDGLSDPSLKLLKMFDPTERSSAPSSTVLILDPCSSLRSFIG